MNRPICYELQLMIASFFDHLLTVVVGCVELYSEEYCGQALTAQETVSKVKLRCRSIVSCARWLRGVPR